MNLEAFFEEERWMPSFGLIGPTEIVFHIPTTSPAIKSYSFLKNTPKPSNKLCEDLADDVRNLVLELREGKAHPLESRVHNLRQMLQSIRADADRTGISDYHKGVPLKQPFFLKECLSHLMALDNKNHFQSDDGIDLLNEMLRKGDFLKLLNHLKEKYIRVQQTIDPHNHHQLELLLSIIYARANQDGFYLGTHLPPNRIPQLWENVYTQYRSRFAALKARLPPPHPSHAFEAATIEQMILVLLGDPAAIGKISEESWQTYLLHRLSAYPNSMGKSREMAEGFMKGKGGLTKEDEMILGVLSGESMHSTYQRLQELLHPYFAHLLGILLLQSGQGVTAALLLDQQYRENIVRGLLEEASLAGWRCFLRVWSFLSIQEGSNWRNQLVEPLLYHHLQFLPEDTLAQAFEVSNKADDLFKFDLHLTVLPQLHAVFSQLKMTQLSLPLIKVAVLCAVSNPNSDNILTQLLSHIDMMFTQHHQQSLRFCADIVRWEKELKMKLRKRNNKRKYACLVKIMPAIEKYQLLRIANGETTNDMAERCKAASKLLKMWRRSLELLTMCRILLNLLNTPKNKETVNWQKEEMQEFGQAAAYFIHNYPGQHTEVEMAELTRIFPYFY